MPKLYKRKTDKVNITKLEEAINAVINNGMSKKAAANQFKVSRSTLTRAIEQGTAQNNSDVPIYRYRYRLADISVFFRHIGIGRYHKNISVVTDITDIYTNQLIQS